MASTNDQLTIIKECVTSLNVANAPKYFLYFMTSEGDKIFTTSSNNIDDASTLALSELISYDPVGIEASITGKILKELKDNYGKHQTPPTPALLKEDEAVDKYFNDNTIDTIILAITLIKDDGSPADSTDTKDTLLGATNKNAPTNRVVIIDYLKANGILTGGSSRSMKNRRRHRNKNKNTKRRNRK